MLVLYVMATQEKLIRERFAEEFQRLAPGPGGEVMNYVEEIKKQGREEGRLEERVRNIESLLHAGTPWRFIESATGVDEAGLRDLKQRLTASSAANGADDTE